MTTDPTDTRLRRPRLERRRARPPAAAGGSACCSVAMVPLALFYFAWLLQPERVGQPGAVRAAARAPSCSTPRRRWASGGRARASAAGAAGRRWAGAPPAVDVFVPVYDEPVDVVEPTVARRDRDARRRRARARCSTTATATRCAAMAARHGAGYLRRERAQRAPRPATSTTRSTAPTRRSSSCSTATTCPSRDFLEATLGHFADDARRVRADAAVLRQLATAARSPAAAWGQQALFFGPIARGKDGHGAMFCCGTNVVFRRAALEDVGGFPDDSVTEDFELSIRAARARLALALRARGARARASARRTWRPTSASSSAGRAAACRRSPTVLRSRAAAAAEGPVPAVGARTSCSGWTVLVYMTLPGRADPHRRAAAGGDDGGPVPRRTSRRTSGCRCSRSPCSAAALHVQGVRAAGGELLDPRAVDDPRRCCGRRGGVRGHAQAGRAGPPAARGRARAGGDRRAASRVAAYGLLRDRDPATLNNVAFAALHVTVLLGGRLARAARAAPLRRPPRPRPAAGVPA